jgi:transposase
MGFQCAYFLWEKDFDLPGSIEDNGFVLYYKALAEEKFRWPREEQTLLTITGEQMNWLLEGYDLSLMKAHKKLHYEALC